MKRYWIPLLIGVILFGIGCGALWFEVTDFSYIDQVPNHTYQEKTENFVFPIVENGNYRIINSDGTIQLQTDDDLKDEIKVAVTYYPDFGKIGHYENSYYENKPVKNIVFYMREIDQWNMLKKIKDMVFTDIKDKTFHNYGLLNDVTIVVTVPTDKKEQISIIPSEDEVDEEIEERAD